MCKLRYDANISHLSSYIILPGGEQVSRCLSSSTEDIHYIPEKETVKPRASLHSASSGGVGRHQVNLQDTKYLRGQKIEIGLIRTLQTWSYTLTWTGSWSVLTSCLSLTPHLRITFYISNLMFDIWTTSSQLDVEMSQTDSIIHWKIQCSFRRNYIFVLAGTEADVENDNFPWLLHKFLSA